MLTENHGILADQDIRTLAEQCEMIAPFVDELVRNGVISYGLSSFGYDVRLGNEFKIANNLPLTDGEAIDPKAVSDDHFTTLKTDQPFLIPAHGFVLGHTVEFFDLPSDILALAVGKSTYARAGVAVQITPIEPGFAGQVVIEIANHTPKPVKLYPGEGISQFLFFRGMVPCLTDYATRGGKYQYQIGVTHGRV